MRQLTLLFMTVSLLVGGVPKKISYQGYVTHADGELVKDGYYNVKFKLYELLEEGDPVWEEIQNIYIGSGLLAAVLGKYISLNFSQNMKFLEIEINGEVLSPRQELTSVFYAFHSNKAEQVSYIDTTGAASGKILKYNSEKKMFTIGDDASGDVDGHSLNASDGTPADVVYVDTTGNVGVGISSPGSKLDVKGTLRLSGSKGGYAAFKATDTTSTSSTYTLPISDGTSGSFLKTDGSGNLAWSAPLVTKMEDTDGDTKIQVEETNDDDIIRFDLRGIETFKFSGTRLDILNSGRSVFIGENAGAADDLSYNDNVFIGYDAGKTNTTGAHNVGIGESALKLMTTGSSNVAIGRYALYATTTGYDNVGVGRDVLASNTTGTHNVGVGSYALGGVTTGYSNVGVGLGAFQNLQGGYGNVGVGHSVASNNQINGNNNTAVGNNALDLLSTGSENTALGYHAGKYNQTGTGNLFLGAEAGKSSGSSTSNKLYVGPDSLGSVIGAPLIYGDFSTDNLALNTKTFDSSARGVLAIKDGTAPAGSTGSQVYLYSISGELKVMDASGNETTLSPHNEKDEWEYYSINKNTGKVIRINMERMIRKLEEITGEQFIEYK